MRPGAQAAADAAIAISGTPSSAGSFKDKRVAFIALSFSALSSSDATQRLPGIQEIKLVGTTATIHFEDPLAKSTATLVQVIGGDYASSESSAKGSNESVTVKLQPRCSHFIAEIPAHKAPIESVSLRVIDGTSSGGSTILDQELALHGLTCAPANPKSRTLSLEVPFTPANETKQLTVTYGTKPFATTSEAQWTESLPPAPLKLGVRSIQLQWRRPIGCLAERWDEPTPASQVETWTRSCPRAMLSDSTMCKLISPETADTAAALEACEYRCEVDRGLDALMLPIPVTFERIRISQTTHRPESLYGWADRLEFAGQELTSVVAPGDRRVMLEFASPWDWKDRYGDKIDAIQVLVGQSSSQLDLRGRDEAAVPPPWVPLPTSGRTCTDRVRVVISGTRRYEETTFEVRNGRIELTRPYDYRPHLRFYAVVGGGTLFPYPGSSVQSAVFGDIGMGGQYDLGGPWSLDVEAMGQLTHGRSERSQNQPSDVRTVSYLWFDARAALEWWHHRRFGGAVGMGLGFGTPLSPGDADIGRVGFSTLIEIQPLIVTMSPQRLWFVAGGEARLQRHRDYVADFSEYMFLRFRGAFD